MSGKKYQMDMCSGPLFRKIIIYTIPLMATAVLQNVFSAADLIVVGRYSSHQDMAAVGSCLPICGLIINVFFGISTGTGVLVANGIGAKDKILVSRTIHTSMSFAGIGGVVLMVFGLLSAYPLLKLMNTPDDVMSKAMWYMCIYSIGIPTLSLYAYGSSVMRAMGDTRRPLMYLIFSGIANVVLNFILVAFFGMGVIGVATATMVSFAISALLVIRAMMNMNGALRLKKSLLKIDMKILAEMLRIGLPAGIHGSLFAVTNFIIQGAVNSFGSAAMAGSAATVNIECIICSVCFSFTQAATNFAGQNLGAKNYRRVRRSAFYCAGASAAFVGVISIFCCIFGRQLIGIYNSDPEVIYWGMQRGMVVFASYSLCGIMDSISGSLRGIGRSLGPMLLSILGVCTVRIIWVWLIFPQHRTIPMLLLSYPVSYIVSIILIGGYLFHALKQIDPGRKSGYMSIAG